MNDLGPITQMTLEEPAFAELLWKMTPASLARRISHGGWKAWPYLQLLSRKLVDVSMGRCRRLIVTMPPRHGKPISKEAIVLMGDGSRKPLGDVFPGDFVITHKGRPRRVTAVHDQGELDCVEIKTHTDRTTTAALDHPFMTPRGWCNAGDLGKNNFLSILRKFESDFPEECGDENFRLAGYLIGDGAIKTRSGNIYSHDLEELVDVIVCANALGIDTKIKNNVCYFYKAIPWLKETGLFGKGAYTKIVPDWVFRAPKSQVAQFIGAYFATDGSVTSSKLTYKSGVHTGRSVGCSISFSSVSKELIKGVQHLLSRFDILSNIRMFYTKTPGKEHPYWNLYVLDRRSIDRFIQEIPIFHEKKRKRLAEWKEVLEGMTGDRSANLTVEQIDEITSRPISVAAAANVYGIGERTVFNIRHGDYKRAPISQNYAFDKIVDIAPCRADCRCLTVEEDETFIADDFVVHNSEVVSKWFPLWFLENFPDKRVILCSYEADFATKWGGKVRDLIADNQDILSARFKAKNPAMHSWELVQGGGMACAGAGGPITGKGADLLIVDDPIKNGQEAESLTMRETLWEWWLSTARTRLEPGGGVVVMMTRWHSDDLIGRLINPASYPEKGLKDEWEVYNFPALAEPDSDRHYAQFEVKVNDLSLGALSSPLELARIGNSDIWRDVLGRAKGEALCPDRYNEDDLAKIRGGSSEKVWFSLYQQRPGDEVNEGNVYHCFDELVHLRKVTRNDNCQLFVSLDFNVDPMCAVIGQYDPGLSRMMEQCEILEEIILHNSNTYSMCEVLREKLHKYKSGYTLRLEIYGDAAGTQKTANSRKTNWQIVAEHMALDTTIHYKFIRRDRNPNISDRINAVNGLLRSADGTTRLFIDEKCIELAKDFRKVRWQVDAAGNSTGLLDKRDKDRTHISDAAGYAVEYKFGLRSRAGGKKGMLM